MRKILCRVFSTLSATLFMFVAFAGQSEAVTIYPDADTWMNRCSGPPGECKKPHHLVNHGTTENLQIRRWFGAGCKAEPKSKRPLLQFPLAGLPDADMIANATLGLYYYWQSGNPVGRTVDLHRLTASWDETHANWSYRNMTETCPDPCLGPDVEHYNAGTRWASCEAGPYAGDTTSKNLCEIPEGYLGLLGGGDYDSDSDASAVIPGAFGYITWNVTDLVKEWLSGTANYGILLKDSDEDWDPSLPNVAYRYRFRSREYAGTEYDPYLQVAVVPEPMSLLLLGIGLMGLFGFSRRRCRV